jgi:hypothetical protein
VRQRLRRLLPALFPALWACSVSLTALGATPALPDSLPKVSVKGSPVVVFDWQREHCEEWDVPDAPTRAFRTADGGVTVFASNSNNRPFVGSSLLKVRHTCHSVLTSHENPDPSAYSGLQFLTAFWTDDGMTIRALIHNEYHADHFANACQFSNSMQCWYTTVIAASSTDGGQTFATATPPTIVAAPAFKQESTQGRHRGFFNPTNILYHDGYYYMASDTTGGSQQKAGLCMFRTANVADPTSWRGYDGKDYTSQALDPYRADTSASVPCQPVAGPGTAGSIVWSPARKLFLTVYQHVDQSHPNGEIAYSWSTDLQHWSPPRTLFDQPGMPSQNCADKLRYDYPSVLDPAAPGRNFDTVGSHPVLFLTRFHVSAHCDLPPDRDLVRMQLTIN